MDVDERHKATIFRDSDDYFFAPLTLRVHLVSCVRVFTRSFYPHQNQNFACPVFLYISLFVHSLLKYRFINTVTEMRWNRLGWGGIEQGFGVILI